MGHISQLSFHQRFKLRNSSYGGELRKKRAGRSRRPLSSKHPLHLVLKIDKARLLNRSLRHPKNFAFTLNLIQRWASYFGVGIEQISIQKDHVHLLVRATSRYQFLNFFRVTSGQLAQEFQEKGHLTVTDTPRKTGTQLWKVRPFTRVVKGWKAYRTVRNYIQLNEKEALGVIPYRKERLRGLSIREWQALWA